MKRRRFTSFQCLNRGTCSSFQFVAGRGGGGGGGGGAGPPGRRRLPVTGDLDRQTSGGPADSGRQTATVIL